MFHEPCCALSVCHEMGPRLELFSRVLKDIVLSGRDRFTVNSSVWRNMVKLKSRDVSVPGTINMNSMVHCDCLLAVIASTIPCSRLQCFHFNVCV